MKFIAALLLSASAALAQPPSPSPSAVPKPPAKGAEVTVEQQGSSAADRDLTKTIRRAVVKDESLSAMAKNVKIITVEGRVTLRGPVHSEQEKALIGSLAEKAAGKEKVANLLEVRK